MEYLRHPVGRGRIYGQAFACQQSYISPSSTVRDEAEVYDSYLRASHVFNHARSIRSELFYSSVADHARVWNGTHLYKVAVQDFAAVSNARIGSPESELIEIHSRMWIDRGVWTRAPRYAEIRTEELWVGLTECVAGYFHIGCWHKSYAEWTRAKYRQRLGRVAGWTPAQIEFAFDTFTTWHHSPLPL